MKRAFATLDVFTDTALHGNPLAVVFDADDMAPARMQAIAREFNLSETVFVLSPRDAVNTARVRIFTPARELPFAGHPTVGTAVLLGERRAAEIIGRQDLVVVLEEEVGPVSCVVRRLKGVTRASFALPRLPECLDETIDGPAAASALGLDAPDIGFPGHVPSVASAGVPFAFVPVSGLEAAGRASPRTAAWDATFGERGVFVYTHETRGEGAHIHARMFAPSHGIAEDPATGSAVAALAAVLVRFEDFGDGAHTVMVEQGLEMGRPSLVTLGIEVAGGQLAGGSIGGAAVVVAEGTIDL